MRRLAIIPVRFGRARPIRRGSGWCPRESVLLRGHHHQLLERRPKTLLGERQIRSFARHVCHLDHDPDIGHAIDLLHNAGWVVIRPAGQSGGPEVRCAACGRSYLKRDAVAEFEADLDGLDY